MVKNGKETSVFSQRKIQPKVQTVFEVGND